MTEDKKDNQLDIKSVADIIDQKLSPEAKKILAKLDNQEKLIKYKWLYFKASNLNEFDFREYNSLKELFKATYYRNLKIEDAERKQDEFMVVLDALDKYKRRKPDYETPIKNILINSKKFYDGTEMIINAFKNKIFPLCSEDFPEYKDRDEDESNDEFYTPRELEAIPELSNFENEEETLRDIPDLESEESAAQRRNQRGQGLKILTPSQMLSRPPISFAQLKPGNNSQKLKKEIRPVLYSLYRSKNKQNSL